MAFRTISEPLAGRVAEAVPAERLARAARGRHRHWGRDDALPTVRDPPNGYLAILFRPAITYRMFRPLLLVFLVLPLSAAAQDWAAYEPLLDVKYDDQQDLADQLTAGRTDERDKAAAIFYWITHNIRYDVRLKDEIVAEKKQAPKTYRRAELEELLEERVRYTLKRRRGVCENYARLYQRLCQLAGLECELVAGHARGNYARAGTLGIGHAWNAVRIDGAWQLVDCTWGAGSVSANQKFVPVFRPAYFAPPPLGLSYTHFPNDPAWQLRDEPVTKEAFLRRPHVGPALVRAGGHDFNYDAFDLRTPRRTPLQITFRTLRPVEGQVYCANFTTGKQVDCTVNYAGEEYVVDVPGAAVNNGLFGLVTADSEILLTYRLRTQ